MSDGHDDVCDDVSSWNWSSSFLGSLIPRRPACVSVCVCDPDLETVPGNTDGWC